MSDVKREICDSLDASWQRAKSERLRFREELDSAKHLCLFGAGEVGQAVASDLSDAGVAIRSFCDNNRTLWGTRINDTWPCLSVDELAAMKDEAFVLVTTGYYKEVRAQLEAMGVATYRVIPHRFMVRRDRYWDTVDLPFVKTRLCSLIDILEDEISRRVASVIARSWFRPVGVPDEFALVQTGDQYFPPVIIRLSQDEVLVDAGAFDGDTIADFLRRTGGLFDRVIAYELDVNCFGKLRSYQEGLPEGLRRKVQIHNLGLYDEDRSIRYLANTASSTIRDTTGKTGRVVRLSDHIKGARVSLIKMDIEGAEPKALSGAQELIREQRPRLAVCVYHEPSHLWEIPLAIKAMVPHYRCFLRHHSSQLYETVCYATLEEPCTADAT